MKVAVYIGRAAHQRHWCGAFADGLRRHGLVPEVVAWPERDDRRPVDADVAVFWAHKRRRVIAHQRARGGDYVVLERGYLGDRMGRWASAGWNGLNGHADFNLPTEPERRRFDDYFGGLMQPWRSDGRYVLLLGQVPGDQSIKGVDLDGWYAEAVPVLQRLYDLPVMFRRHPLDRATVAPADAVELEGTLAQALSGAAVAVTWNSNAGVDAVLAGVPTIAVDAGSMARPVAAHHLIEDPPRPDRAAWAAGLAWCQWTAEEMAAGEAWAQLTSGRALAAA